MYNGTCMLLYLTELYMYISHQQLKLLLMLPQFQ